MRIPKMVGPTIALFMLCTWMAASEPSTAAPEAGDKDTAAKAVVETPAEKLTKAVAKERPLGIRINVEGRSRLETQNNLDGSGKYNDEMRYVRLRPRAGVQLDFGKYIEGSVRMSMESYKRWYASPTATAKSVSAPFLASEIYFEDANIKFKKLPGPLSKFSATVGRQAFSKTDGFMFFMGNEGVGGRGGWWDGALLTYKNGPHKLDLFAVYAPKHDTDLPVINQWTASNNLGQGTTSATCGSFCPKPEVLEDENVASFIAYYENRQIKKLDIDVYGAYVHEYAFDRGYEIFRGVNYSSIMQSNYYMYEPDHYFYMMGAHVVKQLPNHIVAVGEFNGEFGSQNPMNYSLYLYKSASNPVSVAATPVKYTPTVTGPVDVRAWSSFGYITKYFDTPKTKPYLRFAWKFNSGQDPKDTKTSGTWDNPFGRWVQNPGGKAPYGNGYYGPAFTDFYNTVMKTELSPTPSYFSNTKILTVEGGFTLVKKIQAYAGYEYWGAWHTFAPNPVWSAYGNTTGANPFINYNLNGTPLFGTGTKRDQIGWAAIYYNLNKTWDGQIKLEKSYFGDYYTADHRNNGYFFRWEINYHFNQLAIPYKSFKKS